MHTLSFWEAFAISIFANLLRAMVKNPQKYQAVKSQMLEIAADITAAFPPDPPVVGAASVTSPGSLA